jgi:hypothetical protein
MPQFLQPQYLSIHPSSTLLMPLNRPHNIQLLQILLFLLTQHLPPRVQRLIHPLLGAKPNNRRRNPLVNPRQRHRTHTPLMLLGQLLYPLYSLLVLLRMPSVGIAGFLLAFGPDGGSKGGGGAGEMAATEGCPLIMQISIRVRDEGRGKGGYVRRTGISPTPVILQNLFISLSSSRYSRL